MPSDRNLLALMIIDPKMIYFYFRFKDSVREKMKSLFSIDGFLEIYPLDELEKDRKCKPMIFKKSFNVNDEKTMEYYFTAKPDTKYDAIFRVPDFETEIPATYFFNKTPRNKPSDDKSEKFSTQKELFEDRQSYF